MHKRCQTAASADKHSKHRFLLVVAAAERAFRFARVNRENGCVVQDSDSSGLEKPFCTDCKLLQNKAGSAMLDFDPASRPSSSTPRKNSPFVMKLEPRLCHSERVTPFLSS